MSGRRRHNSNSIDPNEDPVEGLERVFSNSNLEQMARRRRRQEQENELIESAIPRSESHEALSARYESLNYEVSENKLYREAEYKTSHQITLWRISRNRWIACFFIGVITALVAALIDIGVHYSKDIKFNWILKYLISKCDEEQRGTTSGCMWTVMIAWIAYNCILVTIASCLVIFVAPIAGGSGIPQIKCYLNGIAIPEVVRPQQIFFYVTSNKKIIAEFGVACSVGGGLAAGKEGPMIHSGAVVGAGVSQGKSYSLGIDFGIFKEFRNDRERRDFVSAGAAAGVAAAFGAPIGGVLFSLEEGASFWNQNLTWRMFLSSMISSFTVNCILGWFNGRSGWLSWNGLANFGVFENKDYNVWEIPIFLLIGIIGGVLGALFNYLNTRLTEFRKTYVNSKFGRLFECLLVAAVSAFLAFLTIFAVDDCQPIGRNPTATSTQINQMWCRKGEYSAVASLFFQNPEESVKSLFHSPINSFGVPTLIIFAIEYFLLTLWTFGIAVPSGVFIPAILTGAAWGRLFGIYVERLFPSVTGIDPGKYALAGAAAQLGGVVRMTISLTAIIMEATKDITFGLPIMLVLMITKWVGDMFNEGLYDSHIDLAEVPILGWNPPKMSRNILADKVMRRDVVALERRERVSRIVEILKTTLHHGFPVVDRIEESVTQTLPDYGRLKGYILRTQLFKLLENRVFDEEHASESIPIDFSECQDDDDQNSQIDQLGLSSYDESCWLNIEPFMHPHPHRVPLNTSLPFIFRLFRGLGLRYLFVVNDDNKLRGVITRKDVARFREKRRNREYQVDELYISQ
ncbi:unnamed protein product [Caenorhabditis angaria]|uniref:Chloride channel protein n=1 Tax=Caenorhabditis angaria TaxID=860376 RepID=A0A9P1IVB2_9PELO|nr:unnamed protein product [Caenorhabditis angaria]